MSNKKKKKMQKLSARQAFLKLAKLWDDPLFNAIGDCDSFGVAFVNPIPEIEIVCEGICICVQAMASHGAISQKTYVTMATMVQQHRPNQWRAFSWSKTRAGARARARFCRRMAGLLATRKAQRIS